jgi:quinolinate synthase
MSECSVVIDFETDLRQEIRSLLNQKNAVLLAHFYQEPAIQELADFVGDSLALSQEAARTDADMIVFAGVHFMAETAKILNPDKKVILPDMDAGCSLADSCPAVSFEPFVKAHPDHVVVTYVNCSAEIKALSDIVCTSSNAKKVIESIPKDRQIIFAPDKNLGAYLQKETGRDLLLWDGACTVHEAFSLEKILRLYDKNPKAEFIVHPEAQADILMVASYIGSTAGMINYVKTSDCNEFIVATEVGILHEMQKQVPEKVLIAAPAVEDNTCACSECAFMKLNTVVKLHRCLVEESPEIMVDEKIMKRALLPIERMLNV